MEVCKPHWLSHAAVNKGGKQSGQESSIFALHIGPRGRLATAGLDGTIRIWDISQPLDQSEESLQSASSQRLLALMNRHNGAVLCLRWSPNPLTDTAADNSSVEYTTRLFQTQERWLASGSDDTLVLIWQQKTDQSSAIINPAFESGGQSTAESYTVAHRLTGHSADVNAVEWSIADQGRYLASCSLDGFVIIWDSRRSFQMVKKLSGTPKRPLKGIAWDPLGKFLAAQSNDGHVFIWRISDWRMEHVFESPYSSVHPEAYTYFNRPSWSPDGSVLCIPDIVNRQDSVAVLLERGTWKSEQSLVGHASSVQSVRFSSHLYQPKSRMDQSNNSNNTSSPIMLVAMGSQDGVFSIWSTTNSKPLAVVAGLFEHAIMDISWDDHDIMSANPNRVFVASYDGSVVAITLTELSVVDQHTQMQLQQQNLANSNHSGNVLALPSSIQQAQLRSEPVQVVTNRLDQILTGQSSSSTSIGFSSSSTSPKENQQTCTIATPSIAQPVTIIGGKRRITPQLVSSSSTSSALKPASEQISTGEVYSVVLGRSARKAWLKASINTAPSPIIKTGSFQIINAKGAFTIQSCSSSAEQHDDRPTVLWEESIQSCNAIFAETFSMDHQRQALIVATSTHRLMVFSSTGRQLLPPMLLPSGVIWMACCHNLCMVVLETGSFQVWKLPHFSFIVMDDLPPSPVKSCGDLLNVSFKMLDDESVFIEFHFANNSSMLYSLNSRTFLDLALDSASTAVGSIVDRLVVDALFGRFHQSDNPSPWSSSNNASLPHKDDMQDKDCISSMQKLISNVRANNQYIAQCSTVFLESQIAAARITNDQMRLLSWLPIYAQRLCSDERYDRCAELKQEFASNQAACVILSKVFASSSLPLIRRLC